MVRSGGLHRARWAVIGVVGAVLAVSGATAGAGTTEPPEPAAATAPAATEAPEVPVVTEPVATTEPADPTPSTESPEPTESPETTDGPTATTESPEPPVSTSEPDDFVAPLAIIDVPPNPGAIAIPGTGSVGPAAPYPSTITVSGQTGLITDVDLHLFGVTHSVAADIDVMLVGPGGENIVVMSDVGDAGGFGISNADITFDDSASGPYPSSGSVSGAATYRPTNNAPADTFPAPAPAPSGSTTLAGAFAGTDPNGTWSLYIVDDLTGDIGSIAGGWTLTIDTDAEAATTTTVTSSVNPSLVGESVTFTATVTRSEGSGAPTGTVTFTDGATTLGGPVTLDGSGQATFTTTALIAGSHVITATYSGATGLLASTGSITQVVDTPTSTPAQGQWCNTGAITGPPDFGPATPYPSRITVSGAGTSTSLVTVQLAGVTHTFPSDFDIVLVGPTGESLVLMSDVGSRAVTDLTLTFADGAPPLPPVGQLVSGTYAPTDSDVNPDAPFNPPAPAAPTATTLSTFNGTNPNGVWQLFVIDDSYFDSGSVSGGWCLDIATKEPTSTALTSSLNPSTFGEAVPLTAVVSSGGDPVTSGSITFTDGATTLGVVPVDGSGQATFTSADLAVGSHAITAAYGGNSSLEASVDSVTQVVNLAPTTTTLTSSSSPSTFGQAVAFTATVTSGGDPVTVGSVTFSDGATELADVVVNGSGQATFTTSLLAVGSHAITATFRPPAWFAASSASLTQVVDGVADAGGPYVIDEGQSLALDGSGSAAGPGATYEWDVDDDGEFDDATGVTPTLSWADLEALGFDGEDPPAVHQVTLRLTDGAAFTAVTTVSIANLAPSAAALDDDGPVAEGSTATVTISGVDDPSSADLAGLTYHFDFDADGIIELVESSPTAVVPASFLSNGPGTRTVTAFVADADGGTSAELTTAISITNAAATATIDGPSTAVVGEPVTIKVGAVDPSPDDMAGTFLFTVDWGDGSPPVTLPGPVDPPVTHTYTRAGTFTVVATVVDPDGAVSEPLPFVMTVTEPLTSTTGAPTSTAPGTLPSTGSSTSLVSVFAVVLLAAGAGALLATRRVR